MRSEHYIEAVSIGYQMLEFIFEILMTKTTAGNGGIPLNYDEFKKARFLISKALLARKYGFIGDEIYFEVEEFNNIRKDMTHNMVENNLIYSEVERCAKMISPIYKKIQDKFLTIKGQGGRAV